MHNEMKYFIKQCPAHFGNNANFGRNHCTW